jgi:hypothetical protein
LDLFAANYFSENNFLYRNDGNPNNWINIKCIGAVSNAAAIGAKVKVKAFINEKPVWQLQELSSQTGAFGQNSLNAEFGLGDAVKIDSIQIKWPSGEATVLVGVDANRFLEIREGKNSPPVLIKSIPDVTIFVDVPELRIDLNTVFTDPDGDALMFSAASTNENVATAVTDGPDLFVRPVSVGSAIIMVIAQDGRGGADTTSFDVTVVSDIFTRITEGEVAQDGGARGVSWADFDFDGDLDLFVTSFGKPNAAYRNNGDGTFAKIAGDPVVQEGGNSTGCSWGDYDNDLYLDLFVANGGGQNNFLYHNNGNGTFTKIDTGAIVEEGGASSSGAWGDYDDDGYVDLFVANGSGQNNFLYRNNGNGSFTKITTGAIASEGGSSSGGTWADIDGDGDIDLFVAGSPNLVYRNDGAGNFTKISAGDLGNGASSAAGSWADFDNDGDLDVFVADGNGANDVLYRNNGKGEFTQITSGPVVNDNLSSVGSSWGDFDNDGDVDLFVSNLFGAGGDLLYSNDGNGNFTRITNSVVANKPFLNSHGAAWADYDNDGNLDLFVATATSGFGNLLYHNNGGSNNWINIQCFGTVSNAAAIGAKVKVKAVIGEKPVWQVQEISSQTGIFSQNSLNAEFGLGGASIIDSLRVEWPSKSVTIWTDVQVNQFLQIGENQPPIIAYQIPDTTLVLTATPVNLTLELNNYFFDPEEELLTFSASSSSPRVAIASVSGDTLTVAPKDTGLAAIIVRADDDHGGVTADTFNVKVVRRNQPPRVSNRIPDVTLVATNPGFRLVVDLRNVFSDDDQDALTYSAASSNTKAALATITGNVLTVSPVDSGTATITVNADDGNGGRASTSFVAKTVTKNAKPALVGSGISDQALVKGGASFKQNLRALFSDADSDQLLFGAASSNPRSVSANVSGDALEVAPVDTGRAVITVQANDGKGGEVSTTFNATVYISAPPVIAWLNNIAVQDRGQPIRIETRVTDEDDKAGGIVRGSVLLYYRGAGLPQSSFPPVRMDTVYSQNRDTLLATATIPANAVTERGVEFFLAAKDTHNVPGRLPLTNLFSVRVRVGGEGISKGTPQPSGSSQTGYHLISLPIDANNKKPEAVLADDLGSYDRKRWRFFEWRTDSATASLANVEFPNTADMAPGKAFWLIIRDAGKIVDTGAGVSSTTSEKFSIPLRRGWNLVGNPFSFPAFAAIATSTGGPLSVYAFENGQWSNPFDPAANELQPFTGYAVFCDAACTMLVNPERFPVGNALAQKAGVAAEALWSIRILAQCQEASDGNNLVAAAMGASREWDVNDHPEPPGVGEYVSVYFPHPEWNKLSAAYCTDFRPEPTDAEEWDFEVKTNIQDEVKLSFEGIESVPAEYEIWIVDKALKLSQNLRQIVNYSIAGRGPDHPTRLTLIVSKRGEMEEKYAEFQTAPTAYELSPNFPNPFNPATTIRYALPKAENVTLQVFNLLGEVVATLVNNELKEAGYHAAIWNGRNAAGNMVGSGVYFIRMRAGSFVQTRKMVLVE